MSKKFTPEEIAKIKKYMQAAHTMSASDRELFIAQTIGDVYDPELPIADVLTPIVDFRRTEVGAHEYYLVPTAVTKRVNTLTSGCEIAQINVHPNTRTELTFTSLLTPEYWVCIDEWLAGDHDVLKFYGDSMNESMNRQEIYAVLQLIESAISGTGGTSNDFTVESGETTLTYPVLVNMVRSLAKYGNRFVLISGANVTTDIMLMDFNANTFRAYGLEDLKITHYPIEDLQVTINGVATDVIDPDVAYLVATSDSDRRKPIVFARRKLAALADMADTRVETAKERAIIDTGNVRPMGDDGRLFSRGKAMFESYAAVLLNELAIAKFSK